MSKNSAPPKAGADQQEQPAAAVLTSNDIAGSSKPKPQQKKRPAKTRAEKKKLPEKRPPQMDQQSSSRLESTMERTQDESADGSGSSSDTESSASSGGSGEASELEFGENREPRETKPLLLLQTRALTSTDLVALLNLKRKFEDLPGVLAKTAKSGGTALKDWYADLKLSVSQIEYIRKAVRKDAQDAKQVKKKLAIIRQWFCDVYFLEFGPDQQDHGFIESLRTELAEETPTSIFGASSVRKMRTKLKAFASSNKTMKSAAAATLFGWYPRKRSFGGGRTSQYQKEQKKAKSSTGNKRF